MQQILSIAGLILTILVAYGCDRWVAWLRKLMATTFDMTAYLWQTSLVNLLLAVPLVLLTIHVFNQGKQSKWVSVVFLVVGLLITFAAAFGISFAPNYLSSGLIEFLLPTSRVVFAGAFIALIGLASLALPGKMKSA